MGIVWTIRSPPLSSLCKCTDLANSHAHLYCLPQAFPPASRRAFRPRLTKLIWVVSCRAFGDNVSSTRHCFLGSILMLRCLCCWFVQSACYLGPGLEDNRLIYSSSNPLTTVCLTNTSVSLSPDSSCCLVQTHQHRARTARATRSSLGRTELGRLGRLRLPRSGHAARESVAT